MSAAPTALISGASDGIGLALARLYAGQGWRLALVGRRPAAELPPDLRGGPHLYLPIDLVQPGAARLAAGRLARAGVGRLDLLVHSAALGSFGPPWEEPPARTQELLALNLRAPIDLTHALLPLLLEARGTIAFVSSVVSALASPDYASYSASKAALEGFARSLRAELAGRARVVVLRPGATRTGFHARSGVPAGRLRAARLAPPEQVAAQIARAIARGRPAATLGPLNRLIRLVGRLRG